MAALVSPRGTDPADVWALANSFIPWLRDGDLVVEFDALTYEQGSSKSVPSNVHNAGGQLMGTMTDTQQITAGVHTVDSKGFDTADASLTWSADDNGAVCTLQPSADGSSCTFVAVAPGTSNYTVSDGTRSQTGSMLVTAGDVASLTVTESAPVEQGQAAPAAPAPPDAGAPPPDAGPTG